MKKITIFLFALSLAFNFSFFAFAQEEGGPPADIQQGPSEEEIQQFQNEMGAPPAAFSQQGPEKPNIEEVRSMPEDVKKYFTDKELVQVYCAMTKWKSGDFFSAMNALEKYLLPILEKVKAMGVDVDSPDIASLKEKGREKIDAICSAVTIDEAQKLTRDFQEWGQNEARNSLDNQIRNSLESKLKAEGDKMRAKIQTEVQAFVEQEKTALQAEIQQLVDTLVEQQKSQITAYAVANRGIDPAALNSMIAESKNTINSQVQAFVAEKSALMKQRIKNKVEEIIGPQKAQFEEIGKSLSELGNNINEEIKNNRSQYDVYKKEAFDLRKAMALKMLDKNMEEGLKQLDAANSDIEKAREEDPTIKTVGEIRSDLAQDRKILEGKLDAALEANNDTAFEQALLDFKAKWETYRTDMEKVAGQAVDKACTTALAQFNQGKNQIDKGAEKIKNLQAKCAESASEECASVNKFSDRFNTILGKFGDLKTEMDIAEKMCQNPQDSDRQNLIALLKKIRTDAEDLRTYGKALEAEKEKAIADSVEKICANVLPQLNAAQAEMRNNDLVILKNNLDKCKNKTTKECEAVNALSAKYNEVSSEINKFITDKDTVAKLCGSSADENDLAQMASILNNLKSQGENIRLKAKELQTEQAEKASEKSFCRAVVSELSIAQSGLTAGLNEMAALQKSCSGKKDNKCKTINSWSNKFENIKSSIALTFKKINEVKIQCQKAGNNPPSDDLIQKAESIKNDEGTIKKAVSLLKDEADKAGSNIGNGIWLEAESAVSYNTRKGVSNPMAREVNPSWRPPYFGDGVWYMGAGGDYLNYEFNAPKAGKYNVWVRDYVDKFQPRGVRRIIVEFDGKNYGTFAETSVSAPGDKGAFSWHKIGSGIQFSSGQHRMKITKESTSVGAAILDAFYFTTGDETPPEK